MYMRDSGVMQAVGTKPVTKRKARSGVGVDEVVRAILMDADRGVGRKRIDAKKAAADKARAEAIEAGCIGAAKAAAHVARMDRIKAIYKKGWSSPNGGEVA